MSAEDVKPVVEASAAAAPGTGSVEEQVITQIEFYLSDSNLPFDKFLFTNWANSFHTPQTVITKTPVPESDAASTTSHSTLHPFHLGWLPLSRLTSFKRMQPYLEPAPVGLGSIDAIASALASSDAVEARQFGAEGEAESGWYVRRKSQLQRPEDSMERSLYVKGFPTEELSETATDEEKAAVRAKENALQIELEKWIKALNVGAVKSLRMRRENKNPPKPSAAGAHPPRGDKRGKFKGSIFVEFASKDSVAAYLALDPAPTFNGAPLESMSKAAYVEMKRLIYAPDSKPIVSSAPTRTPFGKNARPFNAWAEQLVGPEGFPKAVAVHERRDNGKDKDGKKRKADDNDGPQEREILFDGVRFSARKSKEGEVEIIDEASVGTGAGEWTNKVLRFTVGAKSGEKDIGEPLNFRALKELAATVARPGFFSLIDRPIAPLPEVKMDAQFPAKLTAPPTVGSAADAPAPAAAHDDRSQAYPAKGQGAFRDTVTDELFAKLQSDVSTFEGRPIEWVRVSPEEERTYTLGRARYHAAQAFEPQTGGAGGRGGRGGGRGGGGRGGGRGGRGAGRGGRGDNKRPRRD